MDGPGRPRPCAAASGPIEDIRPGDVIWFPLGEKHWHGAIQEQLEGRTTGWMKRVSIWIYEGNLQTEYQETVLAQYHGEYDHQQKRHARCDQPTLYRVPFVLPQLETSELDKAQWLKVRQCSHQRQEKRLIRMAKQLPLTDLQVAI